MAHEETKDEKKTIHVGDNLTNLKLIYIPI